jgi:uncharacterized membrane protein YozB (DUF420 family)
MAALEAEAPLAGRIRSPGGFAPVHPWDRNFFLSYVLLIWGVILMGFVPDVIAHVQKREPAFPLVVHVHAVVFVGWLVLLTAQVLLVRAQRIDLHRKLGLAGAGLSLAVLVLGLMTSIVMDRRDLASAHPDPAGFSVQLMDMIAFSGAIGAAMVLRRNPAAHKRLVLLAILSIVDAGFFRWLGVPLMKLLGSGFWPFLTEVYLANFVLIAGIGLYDLATRQRLHSAYILGAAWVGGCLLGAAWLYETPAWKPVAVALIGH